MKIKEAEEVLGVSRATIRFYEKNRLISPKRGENAYRSYTEKEISELQKIILLRRMKVSVENIRLLQEGKRELKDVLKESSEKISDEKKEMEETLHLVNSVSLRNESYSDFKAGDYWQNRGNRLSEDEHFDIYDHPRGRRRERMFDWHLFLLVSAAAAVALAVILPLCWMGWWQLRYYDFTMDLAANIVKARDDGTTVVQQGSEVMRPNDQSVSAFYKMILNEGKGSPFGTKPNGEPVMVSFGDSAVYLYPEHDAEGTVIRYLDAEGGLYAYASELSWDAVSSVFSGQ